MPTDQEEIKRLRRAVLYLAEKLNSAATSANPVGDVGSILRGTYDRKNTTKIRVTKARAAGIRANALGYARIANPYLVDEVLVEAWLAGWDHHNG